MRTRSKATIEPPPRTPSTSLGEVPPRTASAPVNTKTSDRGSNEKNASCHHHSRCFNIDVFGDVEGHRELIDSTKRILIKSKTAVFLGDLIKFHKFPEPSIITRNSLEFIEWIYSNFKHKAIPVEINFMKYMKSTSGILEKNCPGTKIQKGKFHFLLGNKEFRLYNMVVQDGEVNLDKWRSEFGWGEDETERYCAALKWYFAQCQGYFTEDNMMYVHNFANVDVLEKSKLEGINTIICGHNRSTYIEKYFSRRTMKFYKIVRLDLTECAKIHEGILNPESTFENDMNVFKTGSLVRGTREDPLVNCIYQRGKELRYASDKVMFISHFICPNVSASFKEFENMGIHRQVMANLDKLGLKPTLLQGMGMKPIANGHSAIIQAGYGTGKTGLLSIGITNRLACAEEPMQAIIMSQKHRHLFESMTAMAEGIEKVAICVHSEEKTKIEVGDSQCFVTTIDGAVELIDGGVITPSLVRVVVIDQAESVIKSGLYEKLKHVFDLFDNDRTQVIIFGEMIPYAIQKMATDIDPDVRRIRVKSQVDEIRYLEEQSKARMAARAIDRK